MANNFSASAYENICKEILINNYQILTFEQLFQSQLDHDYQFCILRHDVDRFAKNSLNIAKIENNLGIKSTYYFRTTKSSFNKKVIQTIKNLGHEIGYHYEDFAVSSGNYNNAIERYEKNLNRFKELGIDIKTISMHGSPGRKHSSYKLWDKYNYKIKEIIGDANLDVNFNDIYYITDTGRSWANENNLRDYAEGSLVHSISNNIDLIKFIKNNNNSLILQNHPERWISNIFEFSRSYSLDFLTNNLKKIYKRIYH